MRWRTDAFRGDAPQGDDMTCVVIRVDEAELGVRWPFDVALFHRLMSYGPPLEVCKNGKGLLEANPEGLFLSNSYIFMVTLLTHSLNKKLWLISFIYIKCLEGVIGV